MNRYARHMPLFDVKKLKCKTVLVIGLGALGTTVCEKLVRAAPLNLIILDHDKVEKENLTSQLYSENQVGKKKTLSTKQNLLKINSKTKIKVINETLTPTNSKKIISEADLVIDCTDNFFTRYIINKTCNKLKKPWIFGAVLKTAGMQMNILPGKSCLECVFQSPPLNECKCSKVGVLNTAVAVIANLQVTEAIKILLGKKVDTDLIIFDIWKRDLQKIKTKTNKKCRLCS